MLAFEDVSETVSNGTISKERIPPNVNELCESRGSAMIAADPVASANDNSALTIGAKYEKWGFITAGSYATEIRKSK